MSRNFKLGVHFSDVFNITSETLAHYGAFNVSLISDMPLFIDPFLLFASKKEEYQALHRQILSYLSFLKSKADNGALNYALIKSWYSFPEMKQNWLGYSHMGNEGKGLGRVFAMNMHSMMPIAFKDLGNEKITTSSHLEKVGLFNEGVGRDNISDFTTNLILDYLLKYTEVFAQRFIDSNLCRSFSVNKAYFDYELERWMPRIYYLPCFQDDYVILTPKDLLTRDETWINHREMIERFDEISESLENEELRELVNNYFRSNLPANISKKEQEKAIKYARWETIKKYPQIIEYYISAKEQEKEQANCVANSNVLDVQQSLVNNVQSFLTTESLDPRFYDIPPETSYVESLKRIRYLKDCIENKDGYRLFYVDGQPIKREYYLQLIFRFIWYGSAMDVNREVNNGRGPADYKISFGADSATIVEFKLASNSNLRKNLAHQLEIYERANNTGFGIKVIMFFSEEELAKVNRVLMDLNLDNEPNVILIDARPKRSASKEDGDCR